MKKRIWNDGMVALTAWLDGKSGSFWSHCLNDVSCGFQGSVFSVSPLFSFLIHAQMPRIWLLYLSIFNHPFCPPQISHTHARRTYDRALRTLPPSLHSRIWTRYLLWAESRGGATTVAVYRRYLSVDPSVTERYTAILLSENNPDTRPLEAAKLLLSLARKAARGEYTSPEGKSPYQLLGEFLDVVEQHGEAVGLDVEATINSNQKIADEAEAREAASQRPPQSASVDGKLIRFAGPAMALSDGKVLPPHNEDEDPRSLRKLNIEDIVRKDGLEVYKDQAGRLWTGLATYWIKCGEFDRAKLTFERGLASVLTIRDFTQIFDAYSEFSESLVSALMESLENPEEDDEDEDVKETEQELDVKMKEFEELMDRRPFLVNDVLLRRNPNDVQEWEKLVALWGDNDEKVRLCRLTVKSEFSTGRDHRNPPFSVLGCRDIQQGSHHGKPPSRHCELPPAVYQLRQIL